MLREALVYPKWAAERYGNVRVGRQRFEGRHVRPGELAKTADPHRAVANLSVGQRERAPTHGRGADSHDLLRRFAWHPADEEHSSFRVDHLVAAAPIVRDAAAKPA